MKIIYSILSLVFILQISETEAKEYIYVGTFAGDVEKGIYVYEFNREHGTLALIHTLGGMENPTYLEIHPNGKFLYSVNRNSVNEEEGWGSVSSYTIDQTTGKLTHINDQPSHGEAPCHMSLDSRGRMVFIANYGSGSIAGYPIQKDGSLAPASKVVQHTGSSIRGERQSGPHAHSIMVSPKDDFLYAADLGIDRVKTYRIDIKGNTFVPIPASDGIVNPGGGPRHIAISTNQNFAYVLEEMEAHISVFAIEPKFGALNEIQRIPTLPDDYTGTNFCADIHIDPSGKFLYATNRGHNSLAIYEVDKKSGVLTFIERQSVEGDWPRNFLIHPKGEYILVANRKTNNVVVFNRDPSSGKLSNSGIEISVPEPVCIKLLEIK